MPPYTRPAIDHTALLRTELPDGLLAGFNLRKLPKGYLFSTPDDSLDQVFIVRSGRLRVYLAGKNRELSLSFLETGDIYTTHTPTYVQSVAPTALWVMDTRDFASKMATANGMAQVMMRVLGRLLSNAITLIEDLAFREVPVRLARFLVGLAERRGQTLAEGCLISMELGMEDIASLLGTTRPTVSSLINQWEREGLIQRQGRRHMLIPSLDTLTERSRQLDV